jgi:hypothetical protein
MLIDLPDGVVLIESSQLPDGWLHFYYFSADLNSTPKPEFEKAMDGGAVGQELAAEADDSPGASESMIEWKGTNSHD